MLTPERMLYYSSTHKKLREYNFQTKTAGNDWNATIEVNPEFNFFMWLKHFPKSKKATLLHMIEFGKARIDDIFEDGTVKERATIDITNGNCMCEHRDMLFYGTQANEGSPITIHILGENNVGKINFEFPENLTIVEYGFFKDKMFFLYNSNDQPDSGIFLYDLPPTRTGTRKTPSRPTTPTESFSRRTRTLTSSTEESSLIEL